MFSHLETKCIQHKNYSILVIVTFTPRMLYFSLAMFKILLYLYTVHTLENNDNLFSHRAYINSIESSLQKCKMVYSILFVHYGFSSPKTNEILYNLVLVLLISFLPFVTQRVYIFEMEIETHA